MVKSFLWNVADHVSILGNNSHSILYDVFSKLSLIWIKDYSVFNFQYLLNSYRNFNLKKYVKLSSLENRAWMDSQKIQTGLKTVQITMVNSIVILQNVGGFTQVPIHAWNNAWKGTWGLPQAVKLEVQHMTFKCCCDIKPGKKNQIIVVILHLYVHL
jgi:hypothetical protein